MKSKNRVLRIQFVALIPQHSALGRRGAMQRNLFLFLFIVFLGAAATADARQPAKVPRIGYLAGASLSAISARTEAFRQGLRELGYVEEKNVIIEYRSAEGKFEKL